MLVIAVTGGIGSGKSTVSEMFRRHAIPVIDTDQIARQLVSIGQPAHAEITAAFGDDYLNEDGSLNRRALRELIFADAKARTELEDILHPRIHAEVLKQLQELKANYCLIVVPLLARTKQRYPYDRVLVVDVSPEIQLQRISRRDAQDELTTRKMIAAQADRQTLLMMADDVINNNGSLSQLAEQVAQLHEKYLTIANETSDSA